MQSKGCVNKCNYTPAPQGQITHYTKVHCTTLHYTALHCTTLHYTALHTTTQHYTALHRTILHYTALNWAARHCYYFPILAVLLHWCKAIIFG